MTRKFSGATIGTIIDPSGACVPKHAHDWPVLSLFIIGSYRNETELGDVLISAPSAILYRSGAEHRNQVGSLGFEQIEIEFDPDWMGRDVLPNAPVARWNDGQAIAALRDLISVCRSNTSEERVRQSARSFIQCANNAVAPKRPNWIEGVSRRVINDASLKISDLAREVNMHPSWLGSAYKRATGEGLPELAMRTRTEFAAHLLRETDHPAALVALEAGFYDQSHMINNFKHLLGRTPSAVRRDRAAFRSSI